MSVFHRKTRPLLLLDCDGVMGDFVGAYLAALERACGVRRTADEVTDWDIAKSLGLTPEQRAAVTAAVMERGFCAGIKPCPRAVEGVGMVREVCDVHVVTTPWRGHPYWHDERERWLAEYFGLSHEDVTHTHAKRHTLGHVFVDDKLANVSEWQDWHPTGVAVLWDAPYNANSAWHPQIHSWHELRRVAETWGQPSAAGLSHDST